MAAVKNRDHSPRPTVPESAGRAGAGPDNRRGHARRRNRCGRVRIRQGPRRGREPELSHMSLTALLITNGDADLCIRMRRRDSLTSACERRFSRPTTRLGARRMLRSARRSQPHRAAGTGVRRLFARSVWPPMTERDLNPVWPATAIAGSALPRNIKGRKSTAPRSSRRVAVRAVRNPRPRPGRGRRGRARCSDGAPTPRLGGRGGTGEQSARQWGGRESQGPRGPRRAQHP